MSHYSTVETGTPRVISALVSDLDALTEECVFRILSSDFAYAESTRLTKAELRDACSSNLQVILTQLDGSGVPLDTTPAVLTGRIKAERDIPLAALLHAFRVGGRMLWEQIVARSDGTDTDTLPEMAARMWAIIDELSSVATDAYAEARTERDRADVQVRQLMLRSLLWGEVKSRAQEQETLRVLRLTDYATYLVLCIELPDSSAAPDSAWDQILEQHGLRSQWIRELRSHVGLVELAGKHDVRRVLAALGATTTMRVGLSVPFESLESAPQALREAQHAMECGTPGSSTVTVYGDRATALLLARAPEAARDLARAVLGPILDLPGREGPGLLETLACWFDCAGSASAVADRQHFHRNTIHQRLRRIEQLTGRTCSKPAEAAELYLALQAVELGHA